MPDSSSRRSDQRELSRSENISSSTSMDFQESKSTVLASYIPRRSTMYLVSHGIFVSLRQVSSTRYLSTLLKQLRWRLGISVMDRLTLSFSLSLYILFLNIYRFSLFSCLLSPARLSPMKPKNTSESSTRSPRKTDFLS